MPKPTLLQSLFNQPTQTYSGLQRNGSTSSRAQGHGHGHGQQRYHSVRNDMVRVAAASAEKEMEKTPAPLPILPQQQPVVTRAAAAQRTPVFKDKLDEEFFTPTTSPRQSYIDQDESTTTAMGAPLEQPTLRALMDKEASADVVVGANQVGVDADEKDGKVGFSGTDDCPLPVYAEPSNDDDLHHEVVSNTASNGIINGNGSTRLEQPSRRASSSYSVGSSSASQDGSASDASWPTSFSTSAPSASTRVTTPATSENGQSNSRSSSMSTKSGSGSSIRRKKASENRKSMMSTVTTYTDQDWAKDVRWLVSPTQMSPATTPTNWNSSDKRKTWHSPSKAPSINGNTTPTKRSRPQPQFEFDPTTLIPILPSPDAPFQMHLPPRRVVSQGTTSSRRTMGSRRMSAVWEEDEGDDSGPNSPRRVHTDPAPLSSHARARSLSSPQRAPPDRARSPTNASLLSGEASSLAPSLAPSSAFTSASRTVDLPNPLPVTNGGTPSGFTSLVLPRAAHPPAPSKRYSILFGNSSHVDITRSGLGQTTMSTISITKNAASSALGGPRPRFLSLSSLSLLSPGSGSKSDLPKTPSHLLGTLPRPLSITSHTRPPSKVNSHQILCQVYAVAVDGLDDRIVSEKSARKDCYGFVPGRAFVGRAVEVGFEVNNVAKSDWVVGLLDVRKCGALAEFVIVEKRRVARCPRPSPTLTLEQLALLPLCGASAHRAVRTVGIDADTERDSARGRALVLQGHDGAGALAVQALAFAGMHVTAHIPLHPDIQRARTPSTSSASTSSEPDEKHDLRVGHRHSSTRDAEERVRRWGARGVRVGDAVEVVENCDSGAFDLVIDTVGGKRIWDACQRVLAAPGQFTTLVGDVPLVTSPSPSPPTSSDTSPARSSRSHSPFHFNHHNSSSKADANSNNGRAVPSINQHFKANLRSIRRAFKARKAIAYALVSPAADVDQYGEDVRDSLVEAVRRAVEGVFIPYVGNKFVDEHELDEDEEGEAVGGGDEKKGVNGRGSVVEKRRVVPFERAPELFGCGRLGEGRTAVVRVTD